MSATDGPVPDRASMIAAYIRHSELGPADEQHYWGWDAVTSFIQSASPEDGWTLTVDILRAAPDAIIGNIGAGPLEDLVIQHGNSLIDWIEGEARRDPRFRQALAGVWISKGDLFPEVEARLVAASGGAIVPLQNAGDPSLDHDT